MATIEKERSSEQSGNREIDRPNQGQLSRRGYDPLGFSTEEFFANPFSVMRRMQNEMDRLFASALHRGGGEMGESRSWAPAVEVSERDNNLCVCAELPGLRPDDVKVEITDNAVIIQGERKHEHQEQKEGRLLSERHYGRFYRSVPLPEGANSAKAEARFENGELRVTVPVQRQENRRRQIPITGSSQQSNR